MKTFKQFQKAISKTPKGALVAGGLVAAVAGARAIKNLVGYSSDRGVYKGGYGKGNKGLPAGSEGKPTHKMKQMFIKGVPKARVDKKGSAQVSKPKKGSWNDRQLKMTNEGVASLAIKGGSKFIPALMTGIGAAGTIMQSKKRGSRGPFADTPSAEELRKAKLTGKLLKPKQGEAKAASDALSDMNTDKVMGRTTPEVKKAAGERISKAEKEITKPKKGEKKDAIKTVKDFLKARKIEGRTAMRLKQDDELMTKGPGDQLPGARRDYLKNLLKNLRKEEVAIANSMSGGGIAGSVEAGDEPPVNKKKRRGEPKYMARGLLPGARTRFKTGADLLTNLKKNKYT